MITCSERRSAVNVLVGIQVVWWLWWMTFDLFLIDVVSCFGLLFPDSLYCVFLVPWCTSSGSVAVGLRVLKGLWVMAIIFRVFIVVFALFILLIYLYLLHLCINPFFSNSIHANCILCHSFLLGKLICWRRGGGRAVSVVDLQEQLLWMFCWLEHLDKHMLGWVVRLRPCRWVLTVLSEATRC